MAKIKVLGDTIQITSELTEEQFDRVKSYAPEALVMKDAESGDEIFGITRGNAFYSKYGVCFCSVDNEGHLFMTTNNPTQDHSNREEEKELIIKEFAPVIAKLNELEAHVLGVMESIEEIETAVKDSVEFI